MDGRARRRPFTQVARAAHVGAKKDLPFESCLYSISPSTRAVGKRLLLGLEMRDLIRQLPGKCFVRKL